MTLSDCFQAALASLRANKLRNGLTTLVIIFGVAAVICPLAAPGHTRHRPGFRAFAQGALRLPGRPEQIVDNNPQSSSSRPLLLRARARLLQPIRAARLDP